MLQNTHSHHWVQQTDQILVICKWFNQLSSDGSCFCHDLQNVCTMHHPSPSSAVLTKSVTFSPGPAPVTARTDTSYTVLITSPVKGKVIEFWSASAGLVMLCIPESLLLAKKICSGVQTKLEERVLHSVFDVTKQRQHVTCTYAKCHIVDQCRTTCPDTHKPHIATTVL